jgi:DNA-binding beta-propeller fold protein YncE
MTRQSLFPPWIVLIRVLVSPDNAAVYVSASNHSVYSIAVSSNAVLHHRLNPDGGGEMDSMPIGGRRRIAFDRRGTVALVANEAGFVTVIR